MRIDLPNEARFSDVARSLADKANDIDDMYLVVPLRVSDKRLEVVTDDVHLMVVGKDGKEVEIELREQEGKTMAKIAKTEDAEK